MDTRALFGTMIAGSVAVMVFAGRLRPDPKAATTPAPRAHERPWLTRDATEQIVGPGGVLGTLFSDVRLGGDPPSPETRARIAEFARENQVDITFDVAHHTLQAIHFGVTFGGCCGYEAADKLGIRLDRPKTYGGSDRRGDWVDDWSFVAEEGVHVQANINVNRVEVRWEPTITLDEMLDRAESLVGKTRASIRAAAGDHFIEYVGGYRLQVPYAFRRERTVGGFELGFDHGRVSDVSIAVQSPADGDLLTSLRARWGKSRIVEDSTTTWHAHDRTIKAVLDLDRAQLTISQ